jgi:hypothetical protein
MAVRPRKGGRGAEQSRLLARAAGAGFRPQPLRPSRLAEGAGISPDLIEAACRVQTGIPNIAGYYHGRSSKQASYIRAVKKSNGSNVVDCLTEP